MYSLDNPLVTLDWIPVVKKENNMQHQFWQIIWDWIIAVSDCQWSQQFLIMHVIPLTKTNKMNDKSTSHHRIEIYDRYPCTFCPIYVIDVDFQLGEVKVIGQNDHFRVKICIFSYKWIVLITLKLSIEFPIFKNPLHMNFKDLSMILFILLHIEWITPIFPGARRNWFLVYKSAWTVSLAKRACITLWFLVSYYVSLSKSIAHIPAFFALFSVLSVDLQLGEDKVIGQNDNFRVKTCIFSYK